MTTKMANLWKVNTFLNEDLEVVPIDIAFLTFNPNLDASKPLVRLEDSCLAGLVELKRHREVKKRQKQEMGALAYKHYKWYNNMLRVELFTAGPGCRLRLRHWHIESGNVDAFKIDNVQYGAVSIIMGPKIEHWYGANTSGAEDAKSVYYSRTRRNRRDMSQFLNSLGRKRAPQACPYHSDVKKTSTYRASNNFQGRHSIVPNTLKCMCFMQLRCQRIIEENEHDFREEEKRDIIIKSMKARLNRAQYKPLIPMKSNLLTITEE